ncbi:ATP-dependent zinc metalloprotease FtsH [Thermomicrobium sp. 4228-Ro]|uniref:ATP-dependent zinc metalloprotease FtsH n=1 Tax=Thermomicrobium sp. 4228-Ro TaxID=2993937 RepID=UPI0022498676|nr:ATP-dependent zinc metalloprotease FtsH [Thermomicrobium sp. 4228-Ro]MCX2727393.1 ATP-dependent zinc metalloprotease FtsH [Thermomicrobium sp. 4228-Ro]
MADNKWLRNGFVWMILIIAAIAVWVTFVQGGHSGSSLTTQQLAADIKAGKVEQLVMTSGSDEVQVHYYGSQEVRTLRLPTNVDIFELLQTYGIDPQTVNITTKAASQWGNWLGTLTFLLPTIFLIGVIIFMMRQAQGTNNQALSFGKSRARVFTSNRPTVTFDDVAGVDEAKEELREIVEFLKYPEKFAALGARIPRGVLLVGPPGTGKTLLSRAVAGEAGVPFFSISGSEFVEMFVGVGASRVRDLFDQAKRNAPCIVFIDEIDAVGRQRGAGLGGSHDEREQTLNQILVEMDGFDSSTNVIVLAATNRPDVLDPALLRPGRFDRQVVLDRPDLHGRLAILKVHTRGKPLESDVDLEDLARQTPGFSGADLENLVNEAAILAARRNKKTIGRRELYEAIDRVVAGPERKSRRISEREKLMTAYHEAGHALVARMLPHADPVHKVSIVARGMMGGYTRVLPEEDRFFWTKKQFEAQLAVFMAGLVAEELVFQEISTGAANDIERATTLARRMVTEFGMSERLGPLAFGRKEELVFLGREIAEQRNYSDQVAYEIDQEVRRLIDQAYRTAKSILMEHVDKLEKIATLLVEKETLEGHEIEALFDEPRPRPELVGPPVTKPAALMQRPQPAPEPRPAAAPQIRPQPAS